MTVFIECARCGKRGSPTEVNVPARHMAQQYGSSYEWRLPSGWAEYETTKRRFTICPDCKYAVEDAIERAAARPT